MKHCVYVFICRCVNMSMCLKTYFVQDFLISVVFLSMYMWQCLYVFRCLWDFVSMSSIVYVSIYQFVNVYKNLFRKRLSNLCDISLRLLWYIDPSKVSKWSLNRNKSSSLYSLFSHFANFIVDYPIISINFIN